MRHLKRHMTYANVMSSLAVFLMLGGTAFAANRINGNRLENHSVSGIKLKVGSVSGSKLHRGSISNSKLRDSTIRGGSIAKNTLTDREINRSKLGKVSSAVRADNVDGKSATQLLVSCPSGTIDLGAGCAENGTRGAGTGYAASEACVRAGGYLPTAAELVGADNAGRIKISGSEWSSSWSYAAGDPTGAVVNASGISAAANPASSAYEFRCFFTLRER
jgi:hypothetical protein